MFVRTFVYPPVEYYIWGGERGVAALRESVALVDVKVAIFVRVHKVAAVQFTLKFKDANLRIFPFTNHNRVLSVATATKFALHF